MSILQFQCPNYSIHNNHIRSILLGNKRRAGNTASTHVWSCSLTLLCSAALLAGCRHCHISSHISHQRDSYMYYNTMYDIGLFIGWYNTLQPSFILLLLPRQAKTYWQTKYDYDRYRGKLVMRICLVVSCGVISPFTMLFTYVELPGHRPPSQLPVKTKL